MSLETYRCQSSVENNINSNMARQKRFCLSRLGRVTRDDAGPASVSTSPFNGTARKKDQNVSQMTQTMSYSFRRRGPL